MSLDYKNFKLDLIDELRSFRPFYKSSDVQYAIRCPLCGDSRKNSSSTHFYIKIDPNNDTPILYNCYLCNSGGILTSTILKHLELNSLDLNSGLTSYNNHVMKSYKDYRTVDRKLNYTIPIPKDNKKNRLKKKYIEDRLGISFTYEELVRLKTVFSLGDFTLENNIERLTVGEDKAFALDDNYVGFLTVNNELINFRQVLKSKYRRYEKYNILQSLENSKKFYAIPTVIDIMSPERIVINMAEGVFDILGVYYHLHDGGLENNVYVAVTGTGYRSVIDYFIREGFVGNVTLNIYSDNDKGLNPDFYKRMIGGYGIWVEEINIIYNDLYEDFGCHKNNIIPVTRKLQ